MFGMFSNWGPATDYPDVGNVLSYDTVDGAQGTFINIAANLVSLGETWGEDGTQFTGTGTEVGGDEGDCGLFFLQRRP
jgi:hypothetical protein